MAFDNIHLEKGMYHEAGRSFTQVLEQLDPSEGYLRHCRWRTRTPSSASSSASASA